MKLWLDWSAYKDAGMGDAYADIPKHGGDYAKAIAVCINSRQCEADGKQVMCPSYKVSQNPHLSTGGRVKLLKQALSQDPHSHPLSDSELQQAMALCVSCKGCKRECENNVDMPLIKVEYLAQQRALRGLSLRSRLFASVPLWLYRMPWLRHLIQLRNRLPWLAAMGQRLVQLNARVALPVPAAQPFVLNSTPELTASNGEVLLFVDTFTRYFEPAIAEAASTLLQKAGYQVREVGADGSTTASSQRPLCCGRTYLAQGMVAEARAEAARLLHALLPHLQAGATIVGLEASCVLGLRDDALALGLGEDARLLASRVLLLEEFLAREQKSGRLKLKLKPSRAGQALVHGHCHQKATGAMKSMRRVLKLVPGAEAEMIEAGCCGMAGTFGLEAEHHELSVQMAEQGLLPGLRQHEAVTDGPATENPVTLVANGFSCRQQIRNHSTHQPQHLAQYLLACVEE